MSNTLNYPGDHTDYNPDTILGPDLHGAYYTPVTAHYDQDADRTRMTLRPMTQTQLAEFVEARRTETWDGLETRQAIMDLFG